MDDLDLYGGKSWPFLVPILVTLLLGGGIVTYKWVVASDPVTADDAVAIFQAERTPAPAPSPTERTRIKRDHPDKSDVQKAGAAAPSNSQPSAQAPAAEAPPPDAPQRSKTRPQNPTRPQEGVYSWDTRGYEEAAGARRDIPEETQRILTWVGDDRYLEHHYFSEQRESWTEFVNQDNGAAIAMQRNKVTFGPITQDATIDFDPPMLVGPLPYPVGATWKGTWEGKTYGHYEGKVFEHVWIDVGGVSVETWGFEQMTYLQGEQEGEVWSRVWFAPMYALVVKEAFRQDVKADVGSYHGEWEMTLKSLDPAQ